MGHCRNLFLQSHCPSVTGTALTLLILKEVRPRISLHVLGRLLRFGVPLVPAQIGTYLGFASDRFFLRWLSSPDPVVALSNVGLYALGSKFALMVDRLVGAPINSFWGPRRLELLMGGKSDSKETVARICTYGTFCSIYFALILSKLARKCGKSISEINEYKVLRRSIDARGSRPFFLLRVQVFLNEKALEEPAILENFKEVNDSEK